MKNSTIERIWNNSMRGKNTVIGVYTYEIDLNTGEIKRCKTEDINRMWIDHEGKQYDAWETVGTVKHES